MSSPDDELLMSFDPYTIEHLGIKMYSKIPNALAELIANAYDASAERVNVNLYDDGDEKRIVVSDDGYGMSFDEINDKFLRIGRNRRADNAEMSPCGTRRATGKKGLGKLALFGIGNSIKIITTKIDSEQRVEFTLDWEVLKNSYGGSYKPEFSIEKADQEEKGTTIELMQISRNSPFDKEGLAFSLSRLFDFFGPDFRCFITLNDDEPIEVTNTLKFDVIEDVEFTWTFPEFMDEVEAEYINKERINGKIISSVKPLGPNLRGITLFANGRLVNEPEFFGVAESSHGFSYITGWLNVDFVDTLDSDVIATNRQSLNWDSDGMSMLREFLKKLTSKIERDRREKKRAKQKNEIEQRTKVNTQEWLDKVPEKSKENVKNVLTTLVENSELTDEEQASVVQSVHQLVPEYAEYHWRNMHNAIQEVSEEYYQNEDYYTAVAEAVKRYTRKVRDAINSTTKSDRAMMSEAYNLKNKRLDVTRKYKRPDGKSFNPDTIENIQSGQQFFSESVVQSVRNPLAHEEFKDLKMSGLFNEKDCLDALSLISYLYRRLEDGIENISEQNAA